MFAHINLIFVYFKWGFWLLEEVTLLCIEILMLVRNIENF